jgi:hypothetical protein
MSENAIKRKLDAQGYNWANLSLEDINAGAWYSRIEAECMANGLAL